MIYVEGRTHREVAEMLDLPVGTVKSRTRLALQRLRKLMEETP
jgi:RNA polymerase sigma-70 factor (ECF subfamily)